MYTVCWTIWHILEVPGTINCKIQWHWASKFEIRSRVIGWRCPINLVARFLINVWITTSLCITNLNKEISVYHRGCLDLRNYKLINYFYKTIKSKPSCKEYNVACVTLECTGAHEVLLRIRISLEDQTLRW